MEHNRERRKHLRITVMKDATYKNGSCELSCKILNLSLGGIAFACDSEYEVGDIVHINAYLDKSISLYATIVRVEQVQGNGYKFLYGATIEAIPESDYKYYITTKQQEISTVYENGVEKS